MTPAHPSRIRVEGCGASTALSKDCPLTRDEIRKCFEEDWSVEFMEEFLKQGAAAGELFWPAFFDVREESQPIDLAECKILCVVDNL
jgi:hypothetical protein